MTEPKGKQSPINQSLTMLVHGPSKAGKSLLSVSTPPPRVLFDVESAARFLPLRAITWDPADPPPALDGTWDTAVVSVRKWTDATLALQWLTTGDHPFKSATVDSISELQARYVEHVAGRSQVKIQQWGEALREVGWFVRDLRDLTMHPHHPLSAVVLTAMSRDDNKGVTRPHLQGQLQHVIPYLMDVTAYIQVNEDDEGNEERYLLSRRRNGVEAGQRVNGKIPPLLKLPDVSADTVEELIRKNITYQLIMRRVFRDKAPVVESLPAPVPPPAAPGEHGSGEGPDDERKVS